MAVNSTHGQYDAMVTDWQTMSDVCSCERNIYNIDVACQRYLPKLTGQSDAQYAAYARRASFVLFTKRTVEAFHGMVMRKEVHVDGYSSINVDGKGSSVNVYVSKIIKEYLKYGRCGTLVDMPVVEGKLTIADEIEKNVFPRMLFYPCASILNWKTSIINNIETLSLVVLRENEDVAQDEFSHDSQYRYRVLDLVKIGTKYVYRQRIFGHNLEQVEKDFFPMRGGEKLNFIPFYFHGGIDVDYPPLLPIAEQNIHHYLLDADYKHGLHYVALPTPWVAGVDEKNKPASIGPTVLWAFEDSEVSCGMLEFTGAGLQQISSAIDAVIETIVVLASRVIAPQKSSNDESALAAAIRSNSETSSLASIVDSLSADFTNIVRVIVWWTRGNPADVAVSINKDFMPNNMSGSDVLAYITGWLKGGISYESLFQILKKGEVVKGDRSINDEIKDIDDEQKKKALQDLEKAEKMSKFKSADPANPDGKEEDKDPDPESKIRIDKRLTQ